jgi:hypothetical protein
MKQMNARETSLKQTQNETRLNPKPTPKNKKDRTKVYHRRGRQMQRQSNLVNLGYEVGMRVNILNMFQKAT